MLPSTASNIPHIDTVRMSGLIAVSNTELSAGHGQCTKFPSFSELKKTNFSTHAPADSKSFQSQSTLVQRVLINSAVLCNISLTRKFLLLKQKREQLTKRLRSAIGEEELEVSLQLCKELTSENFHDSSDGSYNTNMHVQRRKTSMGWSTRGFCASCEEMTVARNRDFALTVCLVAAKGENTGTARA